MGHFIFGCEVFDFGLRPKQRFKTSFKTLPLFLEIYGAPVIVMIIVIIIITRLTCVTINHYILCYWHLSL